MRNFLACLSILFLLFSCNRDDFNYDSASQPLGFSTDSIMLDTIFSNTRTETYLLKVYNRENKDIVIPRIYLENLQNSQFKINVDGTPGIDFKDVPLRSKDSMHIFIEMAPKGLNSPEMVAEEDLIFNTLGNTQKVKLVSLVENAEFHFSASGTKEISVNTTWDNTKSRVIYGNLKFTNGAKLTIEEGTRVYLHKKANLIIDEGGELAINGNLNNEVIIRSDRHTPRFDSLPGIWGHIEIAKNSTANINYAEIKGGENGLIIRKNTNLNISNTKIFNFMQIGIHSAGGNVTAKNTVINNCGSADLAIENGGTHDIIHSTFAQGIGNGLALYLSNSIREGNDTYYTTLQAAFKNCIFWANRNNSITFNQNNFTTFTYNFDSNIIRNTDGINTAAPGFVNNIININPLFNNPNLSKNYLDVHNNSPAKGNANPTYAALVPLDIKGISRTSTPTIGAYQ